MPPRRLRPARAPRSVRRRCVSSFLLPYFLIRGPSAERGTGLMDRSNRRGQTDEWHRQPDLLGHGHGDRAPADDAHRGGAGIGNGHRPLAIGHRIGAEVELPARGHTLRERTGVDRVGARLGAEISGRVRPRRLPALHQQVGDRDQQGAEHRRDHQCGEHDHLTVLASPSPGQHVTPVAHCRKGGPASCASCWRVTFHCHTSPMRLFENDRVALPWHETTVFGWYVDEYRYWLPSLCGHVMRSDPGTKKAPCTLRRKVSEMLCIAWPAAP